MLQLIERVGYCRQKHGVLKRRDSFANLAQFVQAGQLGQLGQMLPSGPTRQTWPTLTSWPTSPSFVFHPLGLGVAGGAMVVAVCAAAGRANQAQLAQLGKPGKLCPVAPSGPSWPTWPSRAQLAKESRLLKLGPKKIPGVWCHLGGLHLPTKAGQCTPAAPCHAPCVSHPNPTWPRRQPSQHPLSQAPVQPPTGHRLGATRRQGKPPGWQGLCSQGLGPCGGHTTGALAPHTPGLAKRAFCRCTLVPQRGGFLRHQPTAPTKIPRAAA